MLRIDLRALERGPVDTAGALAPDDPLFEGLDFTLGEPVRVRGEVSRPNYHGSGHLYFTLKDADAVLDGVCWRTGVGKLGLRLEEGMEVVCTGRISSYPRSSKYQLVVESVELAGAGALLKLLEDRRKRLAAEGLFDEARKKPIPFLPEVIGVVTSPTGAVIRDILHRLADRGGEPAQARQQREDAQLADAQRNARWLVAVGVLRAQRDDPRLAVFGAGGRGVGEDDPGQPGQVGLLALAEQGRQPRRSHGQRIATTDDQSAHLGVGSQVRERRRQTLEGAGAAAVADHDQFRSRLLQAFHTRRQIPRHAG